LSKQSPLALRAVPESFNFVVGDIVRSPDTQEFVAEYQAALDEGIPKDSDPQDVFYKTLDSWLLALHEVQKRGEGVASYDDPRRRCLCFLDLSRKVSHNLSLFVERNRDVEDSTLLLFGLTREMFRNSQTNPFVTPETRRRFICPEGQEDLFFADLTRDAGYVAPPPNPEFDADLQRLRDSWLEEAVLESPKDFEWDLNWKKH